VVEAWYPGQEQGNVVARVLFGDVNPSGKLPITFPRSLDTTPTKGVFEVAAGADGPRADYAEGLLIGYRWYDAKSIEPLFPFGFGLSYTTFAYAGLAVEGPARVGFTVRNSGNRAGAEVAQVYMSACPGDGAAPPKALAGFAKVQLAPGESRHVSVDLAPEAFQTWDASAHAWTTRSCERKLVVGGSSRDARLTGTLGGAGGGSAANGSSAPAGGDPGGAPPSPTPTPPSAGSGGAGRSASGCAQGGATTAAWQAAALALLLALRRK
jgi:beta-glucosidase